VEVTMEFRKVRDHIEVYDNNKFLFSADTRQEAEKELKTQIYINTQPTKSILRKVI
jgi:hypothetical protein